MVDMLLLLPKSPIFWTVHTQTQEGLVSTQESNIMSSTAEGVHN